MNHCIILTPKTTDQSQVSEDLKEISVFNSLRKIMAVMLEEW